MPSTSPKSTIGNLEVQCPYQNVSERIRTFFVLTDLFGRLEQLRQSFSLKHSTVLTTQQPRRFLGKHICRHPNGDITVSLEEVLLLQHAQAHGPRRQHQSNIDAIFAETSSTTGYITGSRSTSHLPQSRWHAYLGITGTSRPPIPSKGSHQTSCITVGMGLVTSETYTPVHQGDTSLQVPHFTSTTSRTLPTTSTTHPVAHQYLL